MQFEDFTTTEGGIVRAEHYVSGLRCMLDGLEVNLRCLLLDAGPTRARIVLAEGSYTKQLRKMLDEYMASKGYEVCGYERMQNAGTDETLLEYEKKVRG